MEDFFGMCVAQCIFRSILTLYVVAIEFLIVQRRHFIISRGRQLQNLLRLPKSIRVFSERDPGMPDDDIRTSAIFLSFSFTVAALAVVTVAVTDGALEFWNPWILGFAVANPTCIIATVWLSLALVNRKRERLGGGGYDELTEKAEDLAPKYGTAGNTGLERSVQAIWSPWIM